MARRAAKFNGMSVSVKKFLKCFDDSTIFFALTDKESEDDGDYVTGANTNIIFTTPENFLLAVNHAKIPNTTFRLVQGFPPTSEIFVSGHIYRASKVQLRPAQPFIEAQFLNDTKNFRYIINEHKGASYLIRTSLPIPEAFRTHLLKKDESLIPLIQKPDIPALIAENPHRIRFFLKSASAPENILAAVTKEPYTIQYVPTSARTPELIELALKANGATIQFIDDPTPEQCEIALIQTYMALQYIPKSLRTESLLKLAQSLLEADTKTNIQFETLVR